MIEDTQLIDQIHKDALRVLEEVGVKCDAVEVRNVLEDTGLAAQLDPFVPLICRSWKFEPNRKRRWTRWFL